MSHGHCQSNDFARRATTDHNLSAEGELGNDPRAFRKQKFPHTTLVLQDGPGKETYAWILLEHGEAMVSVT